MRLRVTLVLLSPICVLDSGQVGDGNGANHQSFPENHLQLENLFMKVTRMSVRLKGCALISAKPFT
jgi:hypothetical protein